MTDFGSALGVVLLLVVRPHPDLAEIVLPSLRVGVGTVLPATFIGMPLCQGAPVPLPGRSREESPEHLEHFKLESTNR